jgi:hypothetical protein
MNIEPDDLYLNYLPNFISILYQNILNSQNNEQRTREAVKLFEVGFRTLTMAMVSQYVTRDANKISEPYLNRLIRNGISEP